MRKFYFLAIVMTLLLGWQSAQAQDTTAFRFGAFSDGGELILFKNDSTNLYYGPINTNASFNALIYHPQHDKLYCLYDSVQGTGRRDFYEIDPFSNTMTFVYSPSATFLAAACLGPNGIVYAVTGNGGAGPGAIYAIDLQAGTETLFATTDMTFGGGNQVGANISYYPPTDELFLFGGTVDSLVKINVSTQVETRMAVNLNADGGIKATFLDGNVYWLLSDQSYTFDASTMGPLTTSTFTTPDYITDIELLDLITGTDTMSICSSDSAVLHSRFRFDDYHWYLNGQPLATNSRTIQVGTPGVYQLLGQFDTGNLYIWSEEIVVVSETKPTANFGYTPSAPVANMFITFLDSSLFANTYFWDFGDGNQSGAASPTHAYAVPDTYTVTLIVRNDHCTDTFSTTIVVYFPIGVPDAGVAGQYMKVFPNPTQGAASVVATVPAAMPCRLTVYNARGEAVAVLQDGLLEAGEHVFRIQDQLHDDLAPGIYFIQMQSELGITSHKLLIQR